MGKIARPTFKNSKATDFQLMLDMYELFDDPQLLPIHKIKIYRYEDNTEIGKVLYIIMVRALLKDHQLQ